MIFIIGGAWQGKTAYAKTKFGVSDTEILDCGASDVTASLSFAPADIQEQYGKWRCINHYHLLVKQLCATGADPLAFTTVLLRCNPECVILMDEIGNGIVPIEKAERVYREQAGKTGCLLAREAQSVIRLVCGIPTTIKG